MANKSNSLNYQELNDELEGIINKLQDEATSIDESLQLYEKGVKLTTQLSEYLASARNKLEKIASELSE